MTSLRKTNNTRYKRFPSCAGAGNVVQYDGTIVYAGMMKLVDMRDLGDVTSVKVFHSIVRRAHSLVKAGSSCFYRCGSSVMLRLGSSLCKNQRRIKTSG